MRQGCPVRGWMHLFDNTTHQCVCGRWERGFKPNCVPVKPRAECQICERQQACDKDGTLGHHGYKRPGWGFINGDCMGEGHKPFPATDALELYLIAVRGYIARCKARLEELPTVTEIEYHDFIYHGDGRKTPRTRTLRKGVDDEADYKPGTSHPGFAYVQKLAITKLESEVAFASKDEARVMARIEKAKHMLDNQTLGV